MKTAIKSNPQEAIKSIVSKKWKASQPTGKPKVKLGTGRNLGFISDTLFDDDLKQ